MIAGRYEDKRDINEVGPGQYKLPSTLTGPKFSMGTGEKGTKLNRDALTNPPPGTYTIDSNANKNGVSFGKELIKFCLILTTSMAGMVRNPAKTMDKKTKLAGWLFPIPTR